MPTPLERRIDIARLARESDCVAAWRDPAGTNAKSFAFVLAASRGVRGRSRSARTSARAPRGVSNARRPAGPPKAGQRPSAWKPSGADRSARVRPRSGAIVGRCDGVWHAATRDLSAAARAGWRAADGARRRNDSLQVGDAAERARPRSSRSHPVRSPATATRRATGVLPGAKDVRIRRRQPRVDDVAATPALPRRARRLGRHRDRSSPGMRRHAARGRPLVGRLMLQGEGGQSAGPDELASALSVGRIERDERNRDCGRRRRRRRSAAGAKLLSSRAGRCRAHAHRTPPALTDARRTRHR